MGLMISSDTILAEYNLLQSKQVQKGYQVYKKLKIYLLFHFFSNQI